MKKSIALLFLLLALMAAQFTPAHVKLFAPELFAYGDGYGIRSPRFELYVVYSEWKNADMRLLFVMAGKRTADGWSGKIAQVIGTRIASYPPFDCSGEYIYCYGRQDTPAWRGWLEFRGHARPFCGGDKIKDPCRMLRKD